jgi:hypothetical protein
VRVVDLQETIKAHGREQWCPSVRVVLRGEIKMRKVRSNHVLAVDERRKQEQRIRIKKFNKKTKIYLLKK